MKRRTLLQSIAAVIAAPVTLVVQGKANTPQPFDVVQMSADMTLLPWDGKPQRLFHVRADTPWEALGVSGVPRLNEYYSADWHNWRVTHLQVSAVYNEPGLMSVVATYEMKL